MYNLALIAVGRGCTFLLFIGANKGLRRFAAADVSKAESQLVVAETRSREISNGSFVNNLSMMKDRACLEMLGFNQRYLKEIIALLLWPKTKRRTA